MFAQELNDMRIAASNVAKSVNLKVSKSDPSTMVIVFAASLCAVLPLDISQLTFAIIGAVFYAFLQKQDKALQKKPPSPRLRTSMPYNVHTRATKPKSFASTPASSVGPAFKPVVAQSFVPEVRKVSVQPIAAPTFQSKGWDGEIRELLTEITPTVEARKTVEKLAAIMKETIKVIVPEIEITGFASGNLTVGKAFGVAVPEVDMIANVSPQILYSRLQSRNTRPSSGFETVDAKKFQKSALRLFTDRLVAQGFKFRRSAFKGQEPKVTLLAPASLGLWTETIAFDFSVNVATPLYNAALLTECGKIDMRAKDLILLVKRWAKDRGICHTPKGHFSPYMWGLLTMYFLQVSDGEDGSMLPPLEHFAICSGLAARAGAPAGAAPKSTWKPAESTEAQKSVGILFKEFVHFFQEFDWRKEGVSIRLGRRQPPSLKVPAHTIASDDKSLASQVGPSIEDPFQPTQNLADCMNSASFARLKVELSRAQEICARGASLSELLEPWAPDAPEAAEQPREE